VDPGGGILGIRDEFPSVDLEPGARHRPLRLAVRLEGSPLRETPLIEFPGPEREVREMIPGQFASAPAPGGADTGFVLAPGCKLVAFETETRTLAVFDLSGALGPSAACLTGADMSHISARPLAPDPAGGQGERILLIDPHTPHVEGLLSLPDGMRWLTAGDRGAIVLHVDDLGVPAPHLVPMEGLTR